MTEPTTEAGKRQHDLAWGDDTGEEGEAWNGHSWNRGTCPACRDIAAIEAEAAAANAEEIAAGAVLAERARIAEAVRGLWWCSQCWRFSPPLDDRGHVCLGFATRRDPDASEAIAAVLALLDPDA